MPASLRAAVPAGDVILITGAGGTVTLDALGITAVRSASGDVIINSDRILINTGASPSGISSLNAKAGAIGIRSRADLSTVE